jgi:hypothetical protein
VEALIFVWVEVEVRSAQVWSDGLVCLAWGMLFVVVVEGKLLVVVLSEFGLWWRRNDRIGNRRNAILGMLLAAPVERAMMGTKGNDGCCQ